MKKVNGKDKGRNEGRGEGAVEDVEGIENEIDGDPMAYC
jgi:hypothetical protein